MSDERKVNKTEPIQVKAGHLMALIHYVKVKDVRNGGKEMLVDDVDHPGKDIHIRGEELVINALSADQFAEEVKATKTAVAELLVTSPHRPFTVCFEKADGTERTLRGRLVKPEPLLGRSMVEDLDETGKNRMRQVDHRTIKFLVVDGVKYVVK